MKFLLTLLIAATVGASAEGQTTSPKHPSFQLDVQAKRVLVEKATAIKPGDSYQSVTNRLGAPTFDQRLATKHNNPMRVIGRSLKYYLVIWEAGLVSEGHDEFVDVFLDEHDRVRSVHFRLTLE
jgi:hypothetical protein